MRLIFLSWHVFLWRKSSFLQDFSIFIEREYHVSLENHDVMSHFYERE